jgi:NADH-quinone oxidoreductase subunit M
MLTVVQRVVLGEPSKAVAGVEDLTAREIGVLVPLAALTFVVGVWWDSLLRYVAPAAADLAQKVMGS